MIDYKTLRKLCLQSIGGIKYECRGKTHGMPDKQYTFIDNGANVLAVVHLDTVQHCDHFDKITIDKQLNIFNSQLDDRLGVYTVLELLPKLGIKFDVLLTENEETGQSTAQYFTPKNYNWIVEFDRAGTDAVTYDCDCEDILEPYFTIGSGTFSDLCLLNSDCASFNIGIGYYNEHSKRAYFIESEYLDQIQQFIKFYHDYKNIYIPYKNKQYNDNWMDKYKNQFESVPDDKVLYHCETCSFDLFENETITIVGYICCRYCNKEVSQIDPVDCDDCDCETSGCYTCDVWKKTIAL